MARHTYIHKHTSPTEFNVIQVRADGNRPVSKDKPDYLDFLKEGNTPEVIPYVAPIEPTLEELKASKIAMLKFETSNAIFTAYPQYKVNNVTLGGINGYDEAYAEEIRSYINEKKSLCDEKEALILAATSKEELEIIDININ